MKPNITIQDVAREAGVGVSTVSRVINGSDYASPQTRERVRRAVEQLGYHPSPAARGLRQAKTYTIGVLLADLANPVYTEVLRGVEHAAQEAGYGVLIADGQASEEAQARMLRSLYERRVDALFLRGPVVPSPMLARFLDDGIPVFPRVGRSGEDLTIEDPREEDAAALAAYQHLLDLGHGTIAFVSRSRTSRVEHRVQFLRDLALRAGLPSEAVAHYTADGPDECHVAVRRAMEGQSTTAFVAGNHIVAPYVLAAIHAAGLRIPKDVSFLCFGDSAWALAHDPPISVVRFDYYEAGRRAAISLLKQLGESRLLHVPIAEFDPAEFIARRSTGPAHCQ